MECKVTVCWPRKKVSCRSANKHASRCEKFCLEFDLTYVRDMNYCFFPYISKRWLLWKTLGWTGKLKADIIFPKYGIIFGDCGGTVVKALCHKSEGRWFDSRWCHWSFSVT